VKQRVLAGYVTMEDWGSHLMKGQEGEGELSHDINRLLDGHGPVLVLELRGQASLVHVVGDDPAVGSRPVGDKLEGAVVAEDASQSVHLPFEGESLYGDGLLFQDFQGHRLSVQPRQVHVGERSATYIQLQDDALVATQLAVGVK